MENNVPYGLAFLIKSKFRKIIVTTIAIVSIAAVLVGLFFARTYQSRTERYNDIITELEKEVERLSDAVAVYEEASRELDLRVINAEIQDIGELATIEYFYTDVGKFEDPAKLFGKKVPFTFTTKSFITKWEGSIKAGVDIGRVKTEIDQATKKIIIQIPKAKILSHETDPDSYQTLDERDGLFNRVTLEDARTFDSKSREAMEQKVIENGILEKAFDNAKKIIYNIVDSNLANEPGYTIVFKTVDE